MQSYFSDSPGFTSRQYSKVKIKEESTNERSSSNHGQGENKEIKPLPPQDFPGYTPPRIVHCPILHRFRLQQQLLGADLSRLTDMQMGYKAMNDLMIPCVTSCNNSNGLRQYHVSVTCPICRADNTKLDLGYYNDIESAILIYEAHELLHGLVDHLLLLTKEDISMLSSLHITRRSKQLGQPPTSVERPVFEHVTERIVKPQPVDVESMSKTEKLHPPEYNEGNDDHSTHTHSEREKERGKEIKQQWSVMSAEVSPGDRKYQEYLQERRSSCPSSDLVVCVAPDVKPVINLTTIDTDTDTHTAADREVERQTQTQTQIETETQSVSVPPPPPPTPLPLTSNTHSALTARTQTERETETERKKERDTEKEKESVRETERERDVGVKDRSVSVRCVGEEMYSRRDSMQSILISSRPLQICFSNTLLYGSLLCTRKKRNRSTGSFPHIFRWGSEKDNVHMRMLLKQWLKQEIKYLQRDISHDLILIQDLLMIIQEGIRLRCLSGEGIEFTRIHKIVKKLTILPQCHQEKYQGRCNAEHPTVATAAQEIYIKLKHYLELYLAAHDTTSVDETIEISVE